MTISSFPHHDYYTLQLEYFMNKKCKSFENIRIMFASFLFSVPAFYHMNSYHRQSVYYLHSFNFQFVDVTFQDTYVVHQITLVVMLIWQLNLQSVPVTTNVVNSNTANGEKHPIQQYVIKFVCELRKLGALPRVPRLSPPLKLIDTIQLKYC